MKSLKSLVLLGSLIALSAISQAQVSKHALPKALKVAVAPVAHPKRSVKQVAGSIVFFVESGVDIIHGGFAGLDQASANEKYFGPLHLFFVGADKVSGKADQYLESAESYFFGQSN